MDWSVVDLFLNTLDWWQLTLVIVASILIGILLAFFIIYLIIRFVDKSQVSFFNVLFLLSKRKPKKVDTSIRTPQYSYAASERPDGLLDITPPRALPEVKEQVEFPIYELLVEIEHNLNTIKSLSGDNLIPLKSDIWDANRHMEHSLPFNLREPLAHIYLEIHLLNQTVQLSTVLSSKSSFLDERYRKRIAIIAEGLIKSKRDIEQDMHVSQSLTSSTIRHQVS
jgi:hypothetical protein